MQKNYVIRRKIEDQYMYYRHTISKGNYHYVMDKEEAKLLTRSEARRLVREAKYPEKFEIIELKKGVNFYDKETK